MRDACAVVLAGGESRRFGSDKALAQFRGGALIGHVLRGLVDAQFGEICVVAKDPARYAAVAVEITYAKKQSIALVRDQHPSQTPLAGLHAGLLASRFELVFACAADMPFAADPALVDALFAAIEGYDVAVPAAGGSLQPLCALWRRDPCLRAAEELLAGPRPVGPRAILPLVRSTRRDWGDIRPFLDADTPDVLADLERQT
jgi:molybdopterin-guanine dinucleotide biosynthesis protein A